MQRVAERAGFELCKASFGGRHILGHGILKRKEACKPCFGGEGGIRTLDELLTHTHFPGVLLQPLGHLSNPQLTTKLMFFYF